MNKKLRMALLILVLVLVLGAVGVYSASYFVNIDVAGYLNMSNHAIIELNSLNFSNGARIVGT